MYLRRAVFNAPKDISDDNLKKLFEEHGKKFVEAMERQGWRLESELDFYLSLVTTHRDPNQRHYVIVGYFKPSMEEREWIFEDVPVSLIPRLKKRYGNKVRVL